MDIDVTATPNADTPSTETPNTESPMIPKTRFDEVNTAKKQYERELKETREKLEAYEAQKAKEDQSAALARGEHEKIIEAQRSELDKHTDKLKTLTEQVKAYSETVAQLVEAQMESLPENLKLFIDAEDPLGQLSQLNKLRAAGLLSPVQTPHKLPPPSTDADVASRGTTTAMRATEEDREWAQKLGMSVELYLQRKIEAEKWRKINDNG